MKSFRKLYGYASKHLVRHESGIILGTCFFIFPSFVCEYRSDYTCWFQILYNRMALAAILKGVPGNGCREGNHRERRSYARSGKYC